MASQRPWFRISSMRAPPPAPTPAPPPAPAPALVRPTFPFRPPPPQTQPQDPAPPPSLPPTAPPSPPVPAAEPPRPTPAPTPAPPTSPVAAQPPPRFPVAPPPPRSPVAPPPPPTQSLVAPPPPPPPSPPRASSVAASPVTKSPTPAPTTPPRTSPVTKSTLTTSTFFQRPSSSVPTSPQNKTKSPSPSKPTSPVATAATTSALNGKAATPVPSPKIVKPSDNSPPSQSPKYKPFRPPSPLTLPPPQIKASSEGEREEQKSVLVQESIEKPTKLMMHSSPHNHGNAYKAKRDTPPPPSLKEKGTSKKLSDSEELGMRVITIAGDNKGAMMEITSNKKHYPLGTAHSLEKKSGEEGKSSSKEKTEKATTMQSQPKTTFLNSNVQGVNNSIVFNSNYHHNDPGIHLTVVRKGRKD